MAQWLSPSKYNSSSLTRQHYSKMELDIILHTLVYFIYELYSSQTGLYSHSILHYTGISTQSVDSHSQVLCVNFIGRFRHVQHYLTKSEPTDSCGGVIVWGVVVNAMNARHVQAPGNIQINTIKHTIKTLLLSNILEIFKLTFSTSALSRSLVI